jgi:serine/threonine-protein kinase
MDENTPPAVIEQPVVEQPTAPVGVPGEPVATPTPQTAPTGVQTGSDAEGVNGPMPAELHGWNWGAFLFSWIWGVAHNVWLSLLAFIPIANVIMPFVLGAKGNEWAWQHRRFENVEQFRAVQRAWTRWGVGLLIATVIIYGAFIVFTISLVGNMPDAANYTDLTAPTPDQSLLAPTDSADTTETEIESTTEVE